MLIDALGRSWTLPSLDRDAKKSDRFVHRAATPTHWLKLMIRKTTSLFACLFILILAGCDTGSSVEAPTEPLVGSRPNIIFVLTDDQGM